MDSELWYACAGPQHTLPPLNSKVAYFPQGHVEQIYGSAVYIPDGEGYVPDDLPSVIPCLLSDIQLSATPETDEIFATITLNPGIDPVYSEHSKEPPAAPPRKPLFFKKTLTVSDTSTHGGFSVPRRGAEECFDPLDTKADGPSQELVAIDLHGNECKFRHLFRGSPKRHLLTTGWSVFVAAKRLTHGDSVLFLRGEDDRLRIAVLLAPRNQKKQTHMVTVSAFVVGLLESARHANATNSRFTLIYNPRLCPSQYIIPFSKYESSLRNNFAAGQRVKSEFAPGGSEPSTNGKNSTSVVNRTRARSDPEDAAESRLTGTITEISDSSPNWPGSAWRSIKVKWDMPSPHRLERVSPWEISPYTQRVNQPAPYASKRRNKARVMPRAPPMSPCPLVANDETFCNPKRLQNLLASRDFPQRQPLDFDMIPIADHANHGRCDSTTALPSSIPSLPTLYNFGVKSEHPVGADLHLRVPAGLDDQAVGSTTPRLAPQGRPLEWRNRDPRENDSSASSVGTNLSMSTTVPTRLFGVVLNPAPHQGAAEE